MLSPRRREALAALTELGRQWSRDGQVEIDIVVPLENDGPLFGKCKWRVETQVDSGVLSNLQALPVKVPEPKWLEDPRYALFSVGRFIGRLRSAARNDPRVMLVGGSMMFYVDL